MENFLVGTRKNAFNTTTRPQTKVLSKAFLTQRPVPQRSFLWSAFGKVGIWTSKTRQKRLKTSSLAFSKAESPISQTTKTLNIWSRTISKRKNDAKRRRRRSGSASEKRKKASLASLEWLKTCRRRADETKQERAFAPYSSHPVPFGDMVL